MDHIQVNSYSSTVNSVDVKA